MFKNEFIELWTEAMEEAMERIEALGECLCCGQLNAPLGQLGESRDYKCSDCGMVWMS